MRLPLLRVPAYGKGAVKGSGRGIFSSSMWLLQDIVSACERCMRPDKTHCTFCAAVQPRRSSVLRLGTRCYGFPREWYVCVGATVRQALTSLQLEMTPRRRGAEGLPIRLVKAASARQNIMPELWLVGRMPTTDIIF
eukprot:6203082-Pleurochrysis_carterae.AAC.1